MYWNGELLEWHRVVGETEIYQSSLRKLKLEVIHKGGVHNKGTEQYLSIERFKYK
jgi:hypothetical protein